MNIPFARLGMIACLSLSAVQAAERVMEIAFQTPPADDASVKMEGHAEGTPGTFTLLGGPTKSKIVVEDTGLGSKWPTAFRNGYASIASYANTDDRGSVGLLVDGPAKAYLAGDSFRPTTIYMVFRPTDWSGNGRRSLLGTGVTRHGGYVHLKKEKDTLALYCANGQKPKEEGTAKLVVQQAWDPAAWYFVAVSWQQDQKPVLYLRQMAAEGPAASPEAVIGDFASGYSILTPGGWEGSPNNQPLGIGAFYYNPGGGGRGNIDGAGADIAYVRVDSDYVTVQDIAKVFAGQ